MRISKILALVSVLLVFTCFSVYGKGNGQRISRERTAAGEFTGLALDGAAKVLIHFAAVHRVVVTCRENIQDMVTTSVENNMLYIDLNEDIENARVTVDVYLPAIDTINLNGVGSIESDEGSGSDLAIIQTGVGTINLEKYRAGNVTITGNGVGTIKIWAENSLNGDWSGVGTISYKGNPRINMNFNGVGGFKRIKQAAR